MTGYTPVRLADELASLDARLVGTTPRDLPLRTAACTIYDAQVPMRAGAAGLLLGVGVGGLAVRQVAKEAAAAGFDLLVVRDTGLPNDLDVALPVMAIDPGTGWVQVERVLSTLLGGPSREGVDLFDMANATASVVGGAVTIEDLDFRVIAYSTVEGQPIDEPRQAAILGRQVLWQPDQEERYAQVMRSQRPVRFVGSAGGMGRLAIGVRLGGRVLGTMWVIDDGQLPKDAEQLLTSAAEFIAVLLLQRQQAASYGRERRSTLVADLIGGGPAARDAAAALRMLDPPYRVVALASDPGTTARDVPAVRWERFWTMIDGYLATWQPTSGWCVLDGTTYLLLVGEITGQIDRILLNLEVLADRSTATKVRITVGVGSAVDSIEEIPSSRHEADGLARMSEGPREILDSDHHHGRLALWRLASIARDEPRLESPAVRRLQQEDMRRDGQLCQSLEAWLVAGMDVGRAAQALSVHPNTLRYRLRRIRQVSGLGDDPDDLLVAWLTLRLSADRTAINQQGPPDAVGEP